MNATAQVLAIAVAVTSLIAGLAGAGYWLARRSERLPWLLIRVAQVFAGAQLVGALVLLTMRFHPDDDLYWLYSSLPVGVGVFAEQIKISVATNALESRDLDDGAAVEKLPAAEQADLVSSILRRELGVMVIAALVSAFLALRAVVTL